MNTRILFLGLLLALPLGALADESTDVSGPAAQAGNDFKNVGKEWGKGNVGEGFRQLGHGFRDGAKTTGHAIKKGAKKTGEALSGKSSGETKKTTSTVKPAVQVKKDPD